MNPGLVIYWSVILVVMHEIFLLVQFANDVSRSWQTQCCTLICSSLRPSFLSLPFVCNVLFPLDYILATVAKFPNENLWCTSLFITQQKFSFLLVMWKVIQVLDWHLHSLILYWLLLLCYCWIAVRKTFITLLSLIICSPDIGPLRQ